MFFLKKKKSSVLAVFVLALAVFFSGCGGQQGMQKGPAQVKVMKAMQQDTPIASEYAGQISGKDEVKVQSKVSGAVIEKYVQGGEFVTAGQPLYRIDSRQYESAVWQAQAALAQTEATLSNARVDLSRYEALYAAAAIPEQTVATQRANVNAYEAAAEANAALLRRAQQDLADTTIYAPMTGQLAVDDVAVGTFVTAGNTTLVTIGTNDPVYATFSISETDYLKFMGAAMRGEGAPSARVSLTLSDGTAYPIDGRIVETDRALKDNTGTLKIKALFDNPGGLLLPGMFARVKISGQMVPNAILVPERAVQQLLDKSFVMVVENGKSKARTVTLGDKVGSFYIVKDGISANDLVVVEGLTNLQEGVELSPTEVTAADMGFSLENDMKEFNPDVSTLGK
ncbi:efflux RND transporter periplasmic adaptor subunit [Selenomonas sputigena]|uniref:Efflux RND transporter periplasmic adaptor subunit n=1 Tax=Selenomonas sputigena TaxID=69823 RepID=A0ABV3X720_9FIRM